MTTTLDGFVAGDTATLRLVVTPVDDVPTDSTTTARVELLDPAGATRSPTAAPNGDRSVWVAVLDELLAGEYVGRWIVTGTGEGVETVRILVGPAPGVDVGGRTYATTADYANATGAAPPAGARLLLSRASARIDELLVAAVYAVDEDGMPTDPAVVEALRDATCAQARYMTATGGDDAGDGYSQVSIGNVSMSGRMLGGTGGSSGGRYSDDTLGILRRAGLLYGKPWVAW
jgi:hypothetical protein